jgi:hypothetical protein
LLFVLFFAGPAGGIGADLESTVASSSPAKALVQAALQAELVGANADRRRLLQEAFRLDPDYPPLRWHAGHVQRGNAWLPLRVAERHTLADGKVTRYRQLRDRYAGSLAGQVELARWCRKNDLEQLEELHWMQVLALHPQHSEARKRLRVRDVAGRLVTGKQLEAYREREQQIEDAQQQWKQPIRLWKETLSAGNADARAEALNEVAAVDGPEAIPLLERELLGLDEETSLAVLAAVAEFPGPEATNCLVRHALGGATPETRIAAAEYLADRSWFAFVPGLLALLRAPIEMVAHATLLPYGAGFGFTLERETPHGTVARSHHHRTLARTLNIVRDESAVVAATAHTHPDPAAAAQGARLLNRLRQNAQTENRRADAANERVFRVLEIATGQQLPRTPQAWWDWWEQYNELYSTRQHVVSQQRTASTSLRQRRQVGICPSRPVPPQGAFSRAYAPHPGNGRTYVRMNGQLYRVVQRRLSCFPRGTLVWTNTGCLPIEEIRPGDFLLSQHPDSGELSYCAVLQTTRRPPSETVQICLANEEISATRGHPLWVAGKGWQMAKELEVGEYLHGVFGAVRIDGLEAGPMVEAFNLVVAEFHTYFVGRSRVLVHDNLLRDPTSAKLPGLPAD